METATPETDAAFPLSTNWYFPDSDEYLTRRKFAQSLELERDSARRVLEHCRLFVIKRREYYATEEMERAAIGKAIESILGENAKSGGAPR